MLACSRESHKTNRIAVLRSDDSIASYDAATARMVEQARNSIAALLFSKPKPDLRHHKSSSKASCGPHCRARKAHTGSLLPCAEG